MATVFAGCAFLSMKSNHQGESKQRPDRPKAILTPPSCATVEPLVLKCWSLGSEVRVYSLGGEHLTLCCQEFKQSVSRPACVSAAGQ